MPAKIVVGLQSAQMLGNSIVYGASVSPDACKKHRLWGFSQPGCLRKASSMGIQTAPDAWEKYRLGDSVSPDT